MTTTTIAREVDVDALVAEIRALETHVAILETAIAAGRRRETDPADDDAWWIALVRVYGDRTFSARDLVEHARLDVDLATVIGRRSIAEVGLTLRALAKRPHADVRLVRVGRDRDGVVWTITQA
jgi:hypothetical protein